MARSQFQRKRDVLAVWTMGGVSCVIGQFVSMIDSSGHDRSHEVCTSALRSVNFVDVDIVDGGFGDGGVEAGE